MAYRSFLSHNGKTIPLGQRTLLIEMTEIFHHFITKHPELDLAPIASLYRNELDATFYPN